MALSAEDRQQISELIVLNMTGINARVESSYVVIDTKLNGINTHLGKLNGQIVLHQKEIDEIKSIRDKKYQMLDDWFLNYDKNHLALCPQAPRITALEADKHFRVSAKQAIVGFVGFILMLLTISLTTIKLNEEVVLKKHNTLVMELQKQVQDLKDSIKTK